MRVTIKSSCTVKPSGHTWQGVMSLAIFDQVGSITHEPTVYLYRRPPNEHLSHPVAVSDALKDSLSRALKHFYPLAGRVEWSKEGGGRLELHCNAMGAEFIEAETDSELEHILSPQKLRRLIPDVNQMYKHLPYEKIPLLLVQLTRFACGGISLGFAVSQVVSDGAASGHFMSEWARLSRGEILKTVPFFDRTVLRAGEPPRASIHVEPKDFALPTLIKLPKNSDHYQEDELLKMDQYSTARLRLLKEHVEKVKKIANEGREESKISRPYTRYEALSAHLWRCVTKARNHVFPEQPTALMIPMDTRRRVRPSLPSNYFGNAVCDVLANSSSGELTSRPLGYAASRIREAIEGTNNDFIQNTIDSLNSLLDITCMQNLKSHGLDFGWGKEIYMGPGEIEGECSYFMPCPSGDGSLVLELCLQTAHMESFEEHFYHDIHD